MVQFVRENFVKRPAPIGGGGSVSGGVGIGANNVLVPDVSSSDNNSFDGEMLMGSNGRGGFVGGGTSAAGRFQR